MSILCYFAVKVGYRCGLVALHMAVTTLGTSMSIEEIDTEAKRRKITRNGEMFSSRTFLKRLYS